ncbi:MAG: cytochrome C [Candidatus Accumulibacter sp.]|uniref:cytochrome C n=1 Tax=Accumulibacter sp. TaxID=2053492 RepID=UPI00258A53D8|nr:cytochrome C [Accumulibacter sp.]MCM8621969.1 cytochrome C [Accumulibacter sp.]
MGRLVIVSLALSLLSTMAHALPAFARQTGQNCVACHAGGQFPELTPYGRLFKMTGYTIGERATIPLSVMAVGSYAKVRNTSKSDDPSVDFYKNGSAIVASGSLFLAGKVTDNIGVFIQATYDNYSQDAAGNYHGHTQADNMDLRYADRFISADHDLILGVSANNNPSVTDPWNTAPAWMQYVPGASVTSHQFFDGPYPAYGAGTNLAGITAYAYWNKTIYAEFGLYRSADNAFNFMSAGTDKTQLNGTNPYWRLAYTHDWGANSLMLGTSGMVANVYDAGSNMADSNNLGRFRNIGFDGQYQYLLDPHTVTVQVGYMRQKQEYSANTLAAAASPYFLADGVTPVDAANPSDTTNALRAKLTYVYQAKYGGSLSYFNVTGTANTLNQTSGYDSTGLISSTDPNETGITSTRVNGNLSGNPATRGYTLEAFWTPLQYVRIGAQYTGYNKFNGATNNYDGLGRDAKDNNTLRLYIWAAY